MEDELIFKEEDIEALDYLLSILTQSGVMDSTNLNCYLKINSDVDKQFKYYAAIMQHYNCCTQAPNYRFACRVGNRAFIISRRGGFGQLYKDEKEKIRKKGKDRWLDNTGKTITMVTAIVAILMSATALLNSIFKWWEMPN